MAVNVGQGTILQGTISNTLTPLFQLVEVSGPEITVGAKEKTNLADVAKRYRGQLPDGGKITGKVQYDPANATHQWLIGEIVTWPAPLIAWKLICNTQSGTAGFTFNGFLTKFGLIGMNQEDNLEAEIEIQLDGVPTANQ